MKKRNNHPFVSEIKTPVFVV